MHVCVLDVCALSRVAESFPQNTFSKEKEPAVSLTHMCVPPVTQTFFLQVAVARPALPNTVVVAPVTEELNFSFCLI